MKSITPLAALLLALFTASRVGAQNDEARMPVRVVGDRLVTRCEISTRFRRLPVNLFVDFERPCGLELHNRAADGLRVDSGGGQPITIHLAGSDVVVERREHGDEELLDDFTKLYSRELGETACVGSIGSEILERHHVILDLANDMVTLRSPRELSTTPPEPGEGEVLTSITLVNDLVWAPVRLADDQVAALAFTTTRYDSIVSLDYCEELDRPAGDIGSVRLGLLDLSRRVAFRPEEFDHVHPDGALGTIGLNLLRGLRVEIDRVNRWVRIRPARDAEFPAADLEFFHAMVAEEIEPLAAFLEKHGDSRLAREAAEMLMDLQLDEGATAEELRQTLEWVDRTRIDDLRTTEALTTMKTLVAANRPDVAIVAGAIGVEHGRKDRYPEAIHKLHSNLGELLLEAGRGDEAWEHLLSAAFGLPEDGIINLNLGRFYESKGRHRRAMSRYVQAVITPEAGPQAVDALEGLQRKMGGERLSVDLVDRLISGKVWSFGAGTEYEETEETRTDRVVLCELFTNAHFGRRLTEGWRSFAVGGAMAVEGLLSHFPDDRVIVLNHHFPLPEPTALMTELGEYTGRLYGIDRPVYMKINGTRTAPGAGRSRDGEEVYERNRTAVMEALAEPSDYELEVTAELAEGVVSGSFVITGPARADDVNVQVVLVERGVLYPGKAKVVVHRMVVRGSLLDDVDGTPYDPIGSVMRGEFSRSLESVTAANRAHLEAWERDNGGHATRLSLEIDPRQISVIAFVRDLRTHEILQAARIDVGKDPRER